MLSRDELAKRILETCTLHGKFLLRSGVISDVYFDKYLLEANPEILLAATHYMKDLIPGKPDALAGLEMGGIPLATMLSQHTRIPTLFVRKEAKEYGTCNLAEGGPVKGRKLVIIEDVVTSGGAILDAVRELRKLGAEVSEVICVINRESGGPENLAAEGLTLTALFTRSELEGAAK